MIIEYKLYDSKKKKIRPVSSVFFNKKESIAYCNNIKRSFPFLTACKNIGARDVENKHIYELDILDYTEHPKFQNSNKRVLCVLYFDKNKYAYYVESLNLETSNIKMPFSQEDIFLFNIKIVDFYPRYFTYQEAVLCGYK